MSPEEMAEMVYISLEDIGYTSDRDWFNKRIFLSPNNEAFFSVFQFLLPFADPQIYKEKFKFCLPLFDKRREGDFRKVLCSFLQELLETGELVDVPPIKMALFTTPGRSAFLQVLLAVIEWVARKKSSALGILMPPYDASEDTVQSAINFFSKQREADAKLAEELRCEMQKQMEMLVSDLLKTEEAVEASREELTKAQERTRTTEDDELNLRRFSNALSEIASVSGPLRRLLEIVQSDAPSRDAVAMIESLPEDLLQAIPEASPLIEDMNEKISQGEVDMVLYMRLIITILRNRGPLFNDVIEKLSVGSSIDRILADQRNCLQRAKEALHRFGDLIEQQTKLMTDGVRDEFEADEDAIIIAIDPPTISDLRELVYLSEANLNLVEDDCTLPPRAETMPPPSQANLKRKKIGNLNLTSANPPRSGVRHAVHDLSGFSPLTTPTLVSPRIEKLRSERIKRRSIKEVLTSTPFAKPQ